ncbi:MAG: serine O-acetyltransferase [Nitrospirota bacterium]
MFDNIRADFGAVFEMDPAATSRLEVIFTYAGFHAILMHRIAHWLHRMGMPFFARALSQATRFFTGIEIHPAAKIGKSIFIDHGMGVVIGETTEIGEHVVIFQGVTLGGTGKERGKRHPTLGNYVVVGTGAKVLGAITVGDHVKIGANAVVLKSVPPHSTVVGVPGRVVKVHGEKMMEASMLDHVHMPDPLNESLVRMQKQISRLEQKLGMQDPHPGDRSQPVDRPQAPTEKPRQDKPRHEKRQPRPVKTEALTRIREEVEHLTAETVQERHARMARMERDERMKAQALKKRDTAIPLPQESAASPQAADRQQPGGQEQAPAAPLKKKSRRRRRPRRAGEMPRMQQEQMAEVAAGGEAAPTPVERPTMPAPLMIVKSEARPEGQSTGNDASSGNGEG